MCNNKPLPPVDYVEKVIRNLEVATNTLPRDTDIQAAALHNLPLDNDTIAQETRELSRVSFLINEQDMPGTLIDRGTRPTVHFEYDEIFSAFMPRRADRRSHDGTGAHRDLIAQWLGNIRARSKVTSLLETDLSYELGDPSLIANVQRGKCFTSMVRSCLPAKLDFSSWIGEVAKQRLMEKHPKNLSYGELLLWEPYMAPCGSTEEEIAMLAGQNLSMPVVGASGPGRLVWKRTKPKNPRNAWEIEYKNHISKRGKIEEVLLKTEASLVRLAVQIANWLGWCIWRHHVLPMAQMRERRAVSSADIIRAVVEILGDEWFELPFDKVGVLQQWKYMRSFPTSVEDYIYTVDPRTTRVEDA